MPSWTRRIAILTIVASALWAGAVSAQTMTTGGVVQRVDVPTRTVYFTNGSAMTIEPDAVLSSGGAGVSALPRDVAEGSIIQANELHAVSLAPQAR
jgi:hypothetical protein